MKQKRTLSVYILLMMMVAVLAFPTNASAAKVKLSKTNLTLYQGKTKTLKVKNSKKKFKWSSSNKKVAKVNSKGKVTAVGVGTATITAQMKTDAKTKLTCTVKVKAKKVKKVSMSKKTLAVKVGKSKTLKAKISPSDATNKNVVWSSSDPKIAKVKNGKVTGMKAGSAVITVHTLDGNKKATCKVTVKATAAQPPVFDVDENAPVDTTKVSATAKEFLKLLQSYSDRAAADYKKGLKWTYSNSSAQNGRTYEEALAKADAGISPSCNCALPSQWALRSMGRLGYYQDYWDSDPGSSGNDEIYFRKNWKTKTQETMESFCVITHPYKTPAQLIKAGNLLPGDICGFKGLGHTIVYAGNGKWYDTGRGGDGHYENGKYVFKSFGPVASIDMNGKVINTIMRIVK